MKTRLTTLLLCIFTIITTGIAQTRVGIETGINFSHYLGTKDYTAKEIGGMKTGFQIGVTVDHETRNHWVFMSGLSFLQSRSTLAIADHMNFYFPRADVKINNLILPMKIGYNIRANKNLSFMPSVGPYVSYAFSAGECDLVRIHPTDEGSNPETVRWKPMSGYYYEPESGFSGTIAKHKHWDMGAMAGFKAVIYKNYTISFNYNVGILQVFGENLRNSYYQFSIGYQF